MTTQAIQISEPNSITQYQQVNSDVLYVTPPMLNAQFWIDQLALADSKPLLSGAEIEQYNQQSFTDVDVLVDLHQHPDTLGYKELKDKIEGLSSPSAYDRFYADGTKLTEKDWDSLAKSLNIPKIRKSNTVRYGLVTQRVSMRTFPTHTLILNSGMDKDIDRFQELAVFPGEAVAVLHRSQDKKWVLAQKYNYLAWMPEEAIAFGSKEDVLAYHDYGQQTDEAYLVVTGSEIQTVYTPEAPQVSALTLDMGLRFPLAKTADIPALVNGQNPSYHYVIQLPIRQDKSDKLDFTLALIPRTADVNLGYLPYTQQNIVKQIFKFLGERYGWGDRYDGRDCSGILLNVFSSFGLVMTRNSGEQERKALGKIFDLTDLSYDEKMTTLDGMQAGDTLYMSGHAVMYLGPFEGKHYIIHDVAGLGYPTDNETGYYYGELRGVSLTSTEGMWVDAEKNYMTIMRKGRRFVLP